MTKLGSIVIPAYNEATVIERTLRTLVAGLDLTAVDVVVACNGCTDDTAQVAAALELPIRVLDLGPVGKVGALRAAECLDLALPRLYLDADVVLSGASATAVLLALGGDAVAARPPLVYDTASASWTVRRYYACRRALPSVMADLCGAGVYGLSAEARSRFGEFPAVIADDLFAARVVQPHEVQIVPTAPVRVAVPRTARALIGTLARVYRGNAELARNAPDLAPPTTSRTSRELLALVRRPSEWLDVAVYVAIVVRGRRAARRSSGTTWERDETARLPGGRVDVGAAP